MTTPDAAAYDAIAAWYDLEHGDYDDDLNLYAGFAAASAGPVLELACGAGRLLLPLAAAGATITGVDASAAMLARCQARLDETERSVADRVTLARQPMERLSLARHDYHVAFIALGSFQHLASLADRMAALAGVRAHVVAGATLVIDLDQEFPRRCATLAESGALTHIATLPTGAPGERMTHLLSVAPGPAPATYLLRHFYDSYGPAQPLTRTYAETVIAPISAGEIELLLTATGWRLRQRYGDHQLGDYDDGSPRLIVVAQAAEI